MFQCDEGLRRVIDAIPLAIHIVDPQGIILEANRTWLIYFGLTRDDAVGHPLKDIMRSMIFCDSGAVQAVRKDNPWEFNAPAALEAIRTKLPSRTTFNRLKSEAIAHPILDENGELICVVTTMGQAAAASPAEPEPVAEQYQQGPSVRMLGNSKVIEQVRQVLRQVAQSDATVLITGPTGTGKEVAASEIQRRSRRHDKPFVQINCAAIPENLMEAELFGYEKGAFTGALKNGKVGLLEYANGGTVFLDEIGELPLALQPKLLRAIQERVVIRVGGLQAIPIDVRIIASTNRDLASQVEKGLFREDLYYRLNVIPVRMPALKERGNDIILLAETFLNEYNEKYGKQIHLSADICELLLNYSWPGNVRELRNFIERLVVLNSSGILHANEVAEMLYVGRAAEADDALETASLNDATSRLQRRMIQRAMDTYHNTYRAAEALGISQSTLIRKAKRLGVPTAEE